MGNEKNPLISVDEVAIADLTDFEKRRAARMPATSKKTQVVAGQNIVTVEVPKQQTVRSFSADKLKDEKGVRYSDVQKGIQDSSKIKNARFRLSELARGPLSVEEEEEARIEHEIETRLANRLAQVDGEVRKKAYEEGLAQGKSDGKEQVVKNSIPMLEAFQRVTWDFENMRQEIFKANEEFVIRMIYRLAKAVILRELNEDHDYTRRLITQLLERMGTRENIKVFVGQSVFSTAEALKEGLAQSMGQLKNLSIELDAEIPHKGCRVETDFGEIDARIEVQIQNIAAALGVQPAQDESGKKAKEGGE